MTTTTTIITALAATSVVPNGPAPPSIAQEASLLGFVGGPLHKDSPLPREVIAVGLRMLSVPILGGLHHPYVRMLPTRTGVEPVHAFC
jgi:hypothetical protein